MSSQKDGFKMQIRYCRQCGKEFESYRHQQYCSDECRQQKKIGLYKHYEARKILNRCRQCGDTLPLGKMNATFCCPECERIYNNLKKLPWKARTSLQPWIGLAKGTLINDEYSAEYVLTGGE